MTNKIKTINNCSEIEIVEKKSRFIANAAPVETEKQALEFIEKIKKKYWNARHNVFAYQIGEKNQIQRCSDDGEPSGTAGKPILDIISGEELKNVVVVVTRYFGGILLGTGGLVRAYSKSAKEAIMQSGIIEKILYKQINVKVDYSISGKVKYETLQQKQIIYNTIYTDKVEFIIYAQEDKADSFIKKIINITNANAEIIKGESFYLTKI